MKIYSRVHAEAFNSPSAHPALPSLVRGLTWLVGWENSEEILSAWDGIKRQEHRGTNPLSMWDCEMHWMKTWSYKLKGIKEVKELLTSISVFHNFISSNVFIVFGITERTSGTASIGSSTGISGNACRMLFQSSSLGPPFVGVIGRSCYALTDLKCRVFPSASNSSAANTSQKLTRHGLVTKSKGYIAQGWDVSDHTSQAFGDVPRAAMNIGSWPILSWQSLFQPSQLFYPNELINSTKEYFCHARPTPPSPWHPPCLQSEAIPSSKPHVLLRKCYFHLKSTSYALKGLTSKIPALIALVPYGCRSWWISIHKKRWLWPQLPNNAAQCKGVLPSILFSCKNMKQLFEQPDNDRNVQEDVRRTKENT